MSDSLRRVDSDDPRLRAALQEYLERRDRGEPVDREQLLARHAGIAAELRSFLDAEAQLNRLAGDAARPKSPAEQSAEVTTHSVAGRAVDTSHPQPAIPATGGLPEQFGRYRILRTLGSGAMGTVYLAEDAQLQRQVALKTSSFGDDPGDELLARFYREARSAATLRHSNICPVYDVDQIDGRHFISMAYIEGQPLAAWIRPDKPLPERQTLLIVRKLALALQEAHDHGIIHRDLKPGNVMIDAKGEPIITDFGLARRTNHADQSRLTQSGMLVGSPAYMSPEQVEAEPDRLTPATDQYSLGVILYEMLTGNLPFGGSVTNIIAAIMTREPMPLIERRPGLDPRIDALCRKMMARSPADRFPSMTAVADEAAATLRTPRADQASTASAAQSPASQTRPPSGTAAVARSQKEANPDAIVQSARGCLARHDYEQAVQMLERIPESQRSAEILSLLEQARSLAAQVAFLVAEVDAAVRRRDAAGALDQAEKLEAIRPGHPRILDARRRFPRPPREPAPVARRRATQPPSGERPWPPLNRRTMLATVAGALLLAAVTFFLRSGDAVVNVTIHNEGLRVTLRGRSLSIENSHQPVKVTPGEGTLTIQYGELTVESTSFTLKKGANPTVAVELVDGRLVAKLGDALLGEWNLARDHAAAPAGPADSPSAILLSPDWEWTEPENLGPGVNSGDTEVSPSLTEDELTLVFVRTGDVYHSRRDSIDEPFPKAERLPPPISRPKALQSAVSISGDGLLLAIASNRGGRSDQDIYLAERKSIDEPFGPPRMLPVPVNAGAGEFHPNLAPDGLSLIVSSGRKGGSGLVDLHRLTRKSRADEFGNIENLGPVVNTPKADFGGSMTSDGLVLFRSTFHSKPAKFKDDDVVAESVMCVRRSIDEPFSSIVEFGPAFGALPVGVVVSRDGRRIYFSSHQPGGQGKADLYLARRVPKQNPPPNAGAAAPAPAIAPVDAQQAARRQHE